MNQFDRMTLDEIRVLLDGTAREIARRIPDGALFALLIFDGSDEARYVSNAKRSDIVKAMREHANALERMEDTPT
jgi:hypothetical protein